MLNNIELQTLLLVDSKTLTSSIESSLLKYKELINPLSDKENSVKNNELKGRGNKNEMTEVVQQIIEFLNNLGGIKNVLQRGLKDIGYICF